MDIVSYITKLQTNVFQIRNDDDFTDRYWSFTYLCAVGFFKCLLFIFQDLIIDTQLQF